MSATVLVVEDEADVMLTFRIVLQTAGYKVVEACTGEDALALLESFVPDAMIVDLRLPGIDGWQVLASIRQAGLLAHTPHHRVSQRQPRPANKGRPVRLRRPFHQTVQRRALAANARAGPPGLGRAGCRRSRRQQDCPWAFDLATDDAQMRDGVGEDPDPVIESAFAEIDEP